MPDYRFADFAHTLTAYLVYKLGKSLSGCGR